MKKSHPNVKLPVVLENHTGITAADIKKSFWDNLKYRLVKEDETATEYDLFLSLAYAIRDRLVENWVATQKFYRTRKVKRVYYLSLEFLIGRTLGNSIINLQVEENVAKALQDMGFSLEDLREAEIDAGLGNGGLGRLAACFLDSLATLGVPADGYGIRYDYGIFQPENRERIPGGRAGRVDDARTYPWEVARPEYTFRIQFGGRVIDQSNDQGEIGNRMGGYGRRPGHGLRHARSRLRKPDCQQPAALVRQGHRGIRPGIFQQGQLFRGHVEENRVPNPSPRCFTPNDNSPRRPGTAPETAVFLRFGLHPGHPSALQAGAHETLEKLPRCALYPAERHPPRHRHRRVHAQS